MAWRGMRSRHARRCGETTARGRMDLLDLSASILRRAAGPGGQLRRDSLAHDSCRKPVLPVGARICAVGHSVRPDWGQARAAMVSGGGEFAPDPRAARAYQEIDKVYATLNAFTDPLFRSMADRLQDPEHAPGPGRG